jgi:hypothetical protein
LSEGNRTQLLNINWGDWLDVGKDVSPHFCFAFLRLSSQSLAH